MTKTKLLSASLGVLLLGTSLSVVAGNRPGAFSVGLRSGYAFFSQQRHIDNVAVQAVQLGYDFSDHWGMQVSSGLVNTNQKGHNANAGVHGFMNAVDAVYRIGSYGSFEPYVLAGVGVTSLKPATGSSSVNQANANIGLGSQYFVTNSIAVGLEGKDFYSIPGGRNDLMLSAGITVLFGGHAAEAVVPHEYKS